MKKQKNGIKFHWLALFMLILSSGPNTSFGGSEYRSTEFIKKVMGMGYLRSAHVQHHLGRIYKKDREGIQNDKSTVHWFRRAARQGDTNAQYLLKEIKE